jgi:molecular chaperone GrpE
MTLMAKKKNSPESPDMPREEMDAHGASPAAGASGTGPVPNGFADDRADGARPSDATSARREGSDPARVASAADASAVQSGGEGELDLGAEIIRLEGAVAEVQDEKLRLLAEFQNHRRRAERQLQDARQDGMAQLVGALLSPLHNLERALEAARGVEGGEAVVEGLELVLRDVGRALAQRGITEVAPRGQAFDAETMEAVGQIPSPEVPEGHVAEVLQKGMRLGDRLIEPARVLVSMGAPAGDAGADVATED